METKQLHFKWTVSRGQDTYGYNICTLLVDGEKKGACNGGGYDMEGTCLALWLQSDYQDKLKILFADEIKQVSEKPQSEGKNWEGKPYKSSHETVDCRDHFYGARAVKRNKTKECGIELDGGCGFTSIERIAQAIGIKLKWNPESNKSTNHTYYTAIIE